MAVADSYSTAQDTALVQAAPGVLANDTDADANPLTAILDTTVTQRQPDAQRQRRLHLHPDAGYSGPDSFTYHATDGTADSNVVTVSLTVSRLPATTPSSSAVASYVTFGDPAKLDLGQFTIETWFKQTGRGTPNTRARAGSPSCRSDPRRPGGRWARCRRQLILGINTGTANVIAADFEANAGGANQPISGTTMVTQNVWHHAAATFNGTSLGALPRRQPRGDRLAGRRASLGFDPARRPRHDDHLERNRHRPLPGCDR